MIMDEDGDISTEPVELEENEEEMDALLARRG